jgi:hypothetical protein
MTPISLPIPESTTKLQKPCKDCPYSKTVIPGALGGSDPEVYIGQGHGPFWLPCHKTCDFTDPNWKKDTSVQQCAGAAIYRANIDRAFLMPISLQKLEQSDLAFGSPEELYAHHKQISIEEATDYLRYHTADMLMLLEFQKAKNI